MSWLLKVDLSFLLLAFSKKIKNNSVNLFEITVLMPKKNSEQRKPKMVSAKPIFDELGIGPDEARKYMRNFYYEMEKMQDEAEYKAILEKQTLTPEEIWKIKPQTFYAWRVKYDFPRILKYFNEKLNQFNEWKNEFEIDDTFLIKYGISNCIGLKDIKDSDKQKYIFHKKGDNEKATFLSFANLSDKVSTMWGKPESFILVKEFTGYVDWCNQKKIAAHPKNDNNHLFRFTSASNIRSKDIKVFILDELELLKVGGIEVSKNGFGLINPKYFEFVNASFLALKGQISSGGQVLKFDNSIVDDMTCIDLEYPLVEFSNSSVINIRVTNSNIAQWNFYRTHITGKISNSRLSMINIIGGGFNAILDSTFISEVEAQHINELSFLSTYQALKKVYADQGDDKNAIIYFLKEKDLEREALLNNIFAQRVNSRFQLSRLKKNRLLVKAISVAVYQYISSWLNNIYWGYGRRPFRVIGCSLAIILICALVFYSNQELLNMPGSQTKATLSDSFYYSTITFTTLGYGDFTPEGFLRVVASFEALFGGMSIGFLVAGFANLKY